MTPAVRRPGGKGLGRQVVKAIQDRLRLTSRRTSVLIGARPMNALCQAYPELASAVVYLDLRFQVAKAFPTVDEAGDAVRAARRDVETILAEMSDAHYSAAAAWLRQVVGDVPATKSGNALLDAVRKQLDVEFPVRPVTRPRATKGRHRAPSPSAAAHVVPERTAWDVLDELAADNGEVGHALRSFQQACIFDDARTIREAAQRLQEVVNTEGKAIGSAARTRCKRAIETVAKQFEYQLPSAEGLAAVRKFWSAFDNLDATHPIVDVYPRLQSWLTADDREQLGAAIARIYPLKAVSTAAQSRQKLENQIAGHINPLAGMVGQLIGRKGAYRRMFESELVRAATFAESSAGKGWTVRVGRTPVRGLVPARRGFQQWYDDTILLVDETRGKVVLLFVAQFKAGDVASLDVLEQLDDDDIRKGLKKLFLDGKTFEIETGIVPERSAIVTTRLGVAEEQPVIRAGGRRAAPQASKDPGAFATAIGDRQIEFFPLPVDPLDIRALVRFFLIANGKIPSD